MSRKTKAGGWVFALAIVIGVFASPWFAGSAPDPRMKNMLIVSIDGLRPDLALRAEMPHLRRLLKQGSYTFWAQTIPVAVTLPSHTSMLTGTPLEVHGIGFNDVQEGPPVYPGAVTLFDPRADPREERDLAQTEEGRPVAAVMREELKRLLARAPTRPASSGGDAGPE